VDYLQYEADPSVRRKTFEKWRRDETLRVLRVRARRRELRRRVVLWVCASVTTLAALGIAGLYTARFFE
jgi:hypothetical protein